MVASDVNGDSPEKQAEQAASPNENARRTIPLTRLTTLIPTQSAMPLGSKHATEIIR